MPRGRTPVPAIDRFLNKVEIVTESGCWIWMGTLDNKGYGKLRIGSLIDGTRRMMRTHQFAYEYFIGDRKGLFVLHNCDTPACCNPNHLRLGTRSDNTMDMHKRGRAPKLIRVRNEKGQIIDVKPAETQP